MRKITKTILVGLFCTFMVVGTNLCIKSSNKITPVHADTESEMPVRTIGISKDIPHLDVSGLVVRVYEGEDMIYELKDKNMDSAFQEMHSNYYNYWSEKTSLKCIIDLEKDYVIRSLKLCNNLPMPITINLHGKTLEINHGDYWKLDYSLTINGDGGTIKTSRSGDEYNCSIWVDTGRLDVYNTTILGFKTNLSYPIFAMGDGCNDASFVNCKFENCCSTGYGGAICMEKINTISLTGCTFDDCESYYGGAVYLEDIIHGGNNPILTVKGSTFQSCSAYYGGAIYIEDNLAYDYQRGQYAFQRCSFDKSSIKDCTAKFDGGAIYSDCEQGSLYGSLFSFLEISGCKAGRYGGAIYASGFNNDLDHITIFNCSAEYGGGVYGNDRNQSLWCLEIHDCKASKEGGAYYLVYASSDDFTFTKDCTFYNNTPSDGNGTLMSSGSLIILLSVTAGVFLVTTVGFMILYFKKRKGASNRAEN